MRLFPHPFAALVVLTTLSAAAQAPSSPVGPVSPTTGLVLRDDVVRALIQESSGDRIHDGVQRLALLARDNVGGYTEAALWTKAAAEAASEERQPLHPIMDAVTGALLDEGAHHVVAQHQAGGGRHGPHRGRGRLGGGAERGEDDESGEGVWEEAHGESLGPYRSCWGTPSPSS